MRSAVERLQIESNDTRVYFYASARLRSELERLANRDNRALSEWLRLTLARFVDQHRPPTAP